LIEKAFLATLTQNGWLPLECAPLSSHNETERELLLETQIHGGSGFLAD
jgi:hypothetical protein